MKKKAKRSKLATGATPRTSKPAARSRAGPPGANDWRTAALDRVRALIRRGLPDVVEEVKWRKPSNQMRGVPVWSHPACGMICTGETYKAAVKLTFAKGASLDDPSGLFNASLEGGTRRAIDLHEGDRLDERAFVALIRAAAGLGGTVPDNKPDAKSVAKPDAPAGALWKGFLAEARATVPGVEIVQKTYAGPSGTQWVVRAKKRNLAYLKPADGSFLASFALSEGAIAKLDDAGLPARLVDEIRSAPKYPEGRPARVVVDSAKTLKTALSLLAIKVADVKR